MLDYTIIIPARKGSKGLPLKNRALLRYTLNSLPVEIHSKIIVSTDDEIIHELCNQQDIKSIERSRVNSGDTASTKAMLLEVLPQINTRYVILLYLTYPERTWYNIQKGIEYYMHNNCKSLLCAKELKTSPYLMMHKNGINGRQIIKHDLYRRQDYPECFEISHFLCIIDINEIESLNNNLYNDFTCFIPIDNVIDIDTKLDLEEFINEN